VEFLAEGLPARVLVAAGLRVGKQGEGDSAESGKAGEDLALLRRGGTGFVLDAGEGFDGGEDIAGFGLVARGDERDDVRGALSGSWLAFRGISCVRWVVFASRGGNGIVHDMGVLLARGGRRLGFPLRIGWSGSACEDMQRKE
jgi:hypothetical protein